MARASARREHHEIAAAKWRSTREGFTGRGRQLLQWHGRIDAIEVIDLRGLALAEDDEQSRRRAIRQSKYLLKWLAKAEERFCAETERSRRRLRHWTQPHHATRFAGLIEKELRQRRCAEVRMDVGAV